MGFCDNSQHGSPKCQKIITPLALHFIYPELFRKYYKLEFLEKFKKLKRKDQRVNASVLLRRGNKIVKGSRGWEGLGRKRTGGGGKEGQKKVWEEKEE
jgi:hypothetical protein